MVRLAAYLAALVMVAGPCLLQAQSARPAPGIFLGIDVLEQSGFAPLQGKRVGLLTHPAGVNRYGVSTVNVLRRAPGLRLVRLFGPEHGIYGDEAAGKHVPDKLDTRTGLPVSSLYGPTRKPTPGMLAGLDALVIDLQDIGVRSYTYVSAMKLAMEACFEQGVEVVVLDRPNPLGGVKVSGPPLDEALRSYVGSFPGMPYVHGLTIGEIARMAVSVPGWLEIPGSARARGKLTIVPMRGWERRMRWPETGLEWIPTSPNIPTLSAVLGYAMCGLGGQISGWSHGVGSPYPFRFLEHPRQSTRQALLALEELPLRGVAFRLASWRTAEGPERQGIYPRVTDWDAFDPTALSFYMLVLGARWSPSNPFAAAPPDEVRSFNIHTGSQAWWDELVERGGRARAELFLNRWRLAAEEFRQRSRPYWIYP